MMKAVRRNLPAWAGTGSALADAVDASATGREGGALVHGSATPLVDHGQGRVSDLALRLPPNATTRASQGTTRPAPQNADIPPVTFPGGKNPYLDRPLPLPPSKTAAAAVARSTTTTTTTSTTTPVFLFSMPTRPSTSSGPGSSNMAGSRPNFEKRLSKDDMALPGGFMSRSKSSAARPPWTLTPEPSPRRARTPSPPRVLSPPLLTPQSATSGEIPIGMALGSPIGMALGSPTRDVISRAESRAQSRAASPYRSASPYGGGPQAAWVPQSQAWTETTKAGTTATVTATVSHSPPPAPTPEPTLQRSKTQKRRLFGLFGSRRHAEHPKVGEKAEASRSTVSVAPSISNEAAVPARSHTVAGTSRSKHKPIIVKKHPEAKTPEPPFPTISKPILATPSPKPGGFLNVDIPDIRLERYSVMFSGVLNADGNNNNNNKSLLERRQATLEKLKTIGDDTENDASHSRVPPRRATSPQPMRSPTFSLFPSDRQSNYIASSGFAMASTTSLAPPPSRGLTRSNTSPAYLPSPSRTTFAAPPMPQQDSLEPPRREKKTVTILSPRAMEERNRTAQLERLRAQQQQQQAQQRSQTLPRDPRPVPATRSTAATGFYFGPNNSTLVLDSPHSISSEDDSDNDDDNDSRPARRPLPPSMKPYIPEPEWEIIAPPSITAAPSSSSSSSSSASSASSADSTSTAATSLSSTAAAPSPTTTTTTTNRSKHIPTISVASIASVASTTSLDVPRISVDEEDAALKAAVEISIARQISISRQQHRLLRPLVQQRQQQRSPSPGVGGGGGKTGGKVGGGGGNLDDEVTIGIIKGRVTPVMVGPGGSGVEHRRSERVVLDVA
ncbi:hypothetical protein VTJ49DRAFT_6742 [Mycothermus thermophilus]|uniref:Uncharacterized protein n=1 Tax=Humicola insolens TaxID=85995 RepID=A0ABR3V0Y0_HUMIN